MMLHDKTGLKWKLINVLLIGYTRGLLHLLIYLHAGPYYICIFWVLYCSQTHSKEREKVNPANFKNVEAIIKSNKYPREFYEKHKMSMLLRMRKGSNETRKIQFRLFTFQVT